MQQFNVLHPPSIYMVQVVINRLANEQPRQKLVYVGILATIDALQAKGEAATAQRLSTLYGVDYPSMTKYLKTLVNVGILEVRRVRNSQGRGRLQELYFAETKELREILGFTLKAIADEPVLINQL